MTALPDTAMAPQMVAGPPPGDHRGSWLPNGAMVVQRALELMRRRGLMIAIAVVIVGIPAVFLIVRLLAHAFDPKSYGPAGGYSIFGALVAGVLYIFGFVMAATLGCTAGAVDLQEGVFRHLVVTGRSRVSIYLARVPAGLAIIGAVMAFSYAFICVVCSFAAPTVLTYNGANVPIGLSRPALAAWAGDNYNEVLCNFPFRLEKVPGIQRAELAPIPCDQNGNIDLSLLPPGAHHLTTAEYRSLAMTVASEDYTDYSKQFLAPPIGLMVRTGLWVLLEVCIGFMVGLGLASLIGQRTVSVILMIVLEVILTPIFLRTHIPYMINLQRSIIGVATAHLGPSALPTAFGGGSASDQSQIVFETHWEAAIVVVAWLVGWTLLGAWRMATRDT